MLTGVSFVGSRSSKKGTSTFRTFDPIRNDFLPTLFYEATEEEINEACVLADQATSALRFMPKGRMVFFLSVVKQELESLRAQILGQYVLETGLSVTRAISEFERTTTLLSSYAAYIASGSFPECSIDKPLDPNIPELRKTRIGIGPVAVFGASNFPLAYSTVGGDTVSAWVAGCPVIVKSHPMHAGTGELVSSCIIKAVKKSNFPEGIFSNLNGKSFEVGEKLIRHPMIKAVGFTGSQKGGRALFDIAAVRHEPIPVFAEMGSVNPVILMDDSQNELSKQAYLLARSITTDAGQFCTKPGIIFVKNGSFDFFRKELTDLLQEAPVCTMLHPEIRSRYLDRLNEIAKTEGVVQHLFEGNVKPMEGIKAISQTTMENFLIHTTLHEEVFGPHILLVNYNRLEDVKRALGLLGGQLTVSIFSSDTQFLKQSPISNVIYALAGRIILNGTPTGVIVSASSNHGGPYPASTDSRFSAVGLDSWRRFSRGIAIQNFSADLLPEVFATEAYPK